MSTNDTQHIYSAEYENGGGGSTPASSVSYDNTSSGLDAVTAQAAIDEIEAQIDALAAQDVESTGIGDTTNVQGALDYIMSVKIDGAYNNAISGLSATTLQGAVDELAGDAKAVYKFVEHVNITGTTTTGGVDGAFTDALTNLNTALSQLDDNEYLIAETIAVPNMGTYLARNLDNLWGKNDVVTSIEGSLISTSTNNVIIRACQLNPSVNRLFYIDIAIPTGTISATDHLSTTGELTVTIKCRKYSK